MSALDRGLRRELAKAVRAARKTAEAGARNALTALTVAAAEPDSSLSEEDRALRRRLRAHGRQLGDLRQGAEQEVGRLAHEVAYEHWHRMLFARFLAENGLLVEPVHQVPVSLDECRDIARESRRDIWAVAAEFAAAMLPRIFRPDDPSLAVRLPPETRRELERTLADLPPAVFLADDSLGWTYQFWQADRKDEVNESEVKIGADELPAVTQLFTEPYMVRFLFHNTVGAWRAGRILSERPDLAQNAESEDELRRAVRLESAGGYDFDYLRFVRESHSGTGDGRTCSPWRVAGGSFEKWPRRAANLRVLDPCCGSGHFLIEGLHLFVRLRMEEECLPLRDAIRAVLKDNLHGLELDPRCTQIAAFSVAFAAWKLNRRVFSLPPPQIACSGLAPNATKGEWLTLAERTSGVAGSSPKRSLHGTQQTLAPAALRHTFETMHSLFAQAPTLGSLIDPRATDRSMYAAKYHDIRPLLDSVLAEMETASERTERVITAAGIADAARLLAGTYEIVATNVPYLARSKQGPTLRETGNTLFPASKGDIATMFIERGFGWTGKDGVEAVVAPENWLFLPRYEALRRTLLHDRTWKLIGRLGSRAFRTPMWDFNVVLAILSGDNPSADHRMTGLDVSASRDGAPIVALRKACHLRGSVAVDGNESLRALVRIRQADQLTTPDARIVLDSWQAGSYLSMAARSRTGTRTSDNAALLFLFWEIPSDSQKWRLCQSTVTASTEWGGCERVIRWDRGRGVLHLYASAGTASIQGRDAWGRAGVLVSLMSKTPVTLYTGNLFDMNAGVVLPKEEGQDLASLYAFLASDEFRGSLRTIDRQLKLTTATLLKVPFDSEKWRRRARELYPHGLPEQYSDDPTQWIFHGHPCGSVVWDLEAKRTVDGPARTDNTVLQVAVARLLGHRWPAELDPRMPVAEEQRVWVKRCADLHRFADQDGVVCLPAVRGEESAAKRLRALLAAAYGSEWSPAIEQQLLREASTGGGQRMKSLDHWLQKRFFAEHCRLFHHRPFVWHIWDGLPDGFHALVNYHRLTGANGEGRSTLGALTFSYLGDWIERQRAAQREGMAGADARLSAALELQKQLERILEGAPPLDLFIRWKPLHCQPLGWEPDIDDGVRLNIRPFMRAQLRKGGQRDAGLLRIKPNIHWKKDRGKEPKRLRAKRGSDQLGDIRPRTDFPWFWACPGTGAKDERTDFMGGAEFDGNRWNDLHYTLAAKRAARERHERDGADKPSEDAMAGGAGKGRETA